MGAKFLQSQHICWWALRDKTKSYFSSSPLLFLVPLWLSIYLFFVVCFISHETNCAQLQPWWHYLRLSYVHAVLRNAAYPLWVMGSRERAMGVMPYLSFMLLIPFTNVKSEVWCTLKIMLDFVNCFAVRNLTQWILRRADKEFIWCSF